MGHREDLLVGAKRCLYEKGYAHTTARDIVAASDTNLGSIGYHFGSKDALMNQALLAATAEWGDELAAALSDDEGLPPGSLERFEANWTRIIASFTTHRPLWVAQFEAVATTLRVPAVREFLADAQTQARPGLTELFGTDAGDEPTTKAVGAFYQALLTGTMVQWLIDPDNAPTGADLALALRTVLAATGRVTPPD